MRNIGIDAGTVGAIRRAKIKKGIADLLAKLSMTEQAYVLADLLVALNARVPSIGLAKPRVFKGLAKAKPIPRAQTRLCSTMQRKVLLALAAAPRTSISALAREVYGDASKNHKQGISSCLNSLRKKGLVRHCSQGKWATVRDPVCKPTKPRKSVPTMGSEQILD